MKELFPLLGHKRQQHRAPAGYPAALSLQQDKAGDYDAYGVLPSTILLDLYFSGTESDESLVDYECSSSALPRPSRDTTNRAPTSEVDGDNNLFSQFLRSPSPSPVPFIR